MAVDTLAQLLALHPAAVNVQEQTQVKQLAAQVLEGTGDAVEAARHAKVHDAFVERLVERTKRIRLGDPSHTESEMGPMATTDQLHKVQGFVDRALTDGAELVYDGKRPNAPDLR